ncbi:MAG: hypothetical protein HWD58_02395 [Bacteroidota bacterium]|nr:MAG: hypothetical protein HWD58_02395 [Bacteroidota bacterium]
MLRLNTRHNLGKVKATKNGIPYRMVKMKEFGSEVLAMTEEKRLKKMKSRVYLENSFKETGRHAPILIGVGSNVRARSKSGLGTLRLS